MRRSAEPGHVSCHSIATRPSLELRLSLLQVFYFESNRCYEINISYAVGAYYVFDEKCLGDSDHLGYVVMYKRKASRGVLVSLPNSFTMSPLRHGESSSSRILNYKLTQG